MTIIKNVNSFIKECAQKFPERKASLAPIAANTSMLSTILAYSFISEKMSRNLAKRTVHSLSTRIPPRALQPYEIWCQKQAHASMEKLEPLLDKNPNLSHTLLLLAATHEFHSSHDLKTELTSISHLFLSALRFLAYQIPEFPFSSSILAADCKAHREQIVQNAILPAVKKTYGKTIKQIAITTCSLANLALVSSLVSFTFSRIFTPAQLHMREQGINALQGLQWGITICLYAPLVYHGIKVIPEIWSTYQATKTYEKKLNFLHKQLSIHPKAVKLPQSSIKALSLLLATIY